MINIISQESGSLYNQIAKSTYEYLHLAGEADVELIIVDEEEIRELNMSTRGIDKVTDVLSYPSLNSIMPFTLENYPIDYNMDTKSVFLGSVVICETVAVKQAEEYGHSEEREKAYLFLHGLLHLLGYDHISEEDKTIMRSYEEKILGELGVTR